MMERIYRQIKNLLYLTTLKIILIISDLLLIFATILYNAGVDMKAANKLNDYFK